MKTKVVLLTAGFFFSTLGAFAQKGVDAGTQFGSGEDSIRCITNISLFVPYAKSGDFASAYTPWKLAYEECPAATKDIYLYGVRILDWKINNEADAATRAAVLEDLITLYDTRVKYFGDDDRYGKDWIVSRKAQDYLTKAGSNVDFNRVYGWLDEVVTEYGQKTEPLAISLFMFASHQRLLANPDNMKAEYIENYLKSTALIDAQMEVAKAANNERDINALTVFKKGIDDNFAGSGAADCDILQGLYAAKIEENKGDLEFLKETIALLRRVRCQEIDAYFAAAEYVHAQEPTAESAMGLGRQAIKTGDYNAAIVLLEEAASLATEDQMKADCYYTIAVLLMDQNNYSRARQYCHRALEFVPSYGNAYLLIGRMYASTAQSVYPNDGVLRRVVYYAAVDKFERARQVDPSVASDASSLISSYRPHFPSNEDVFMHPDVNKGETFTVGGWINERVVIR